MIAFYIVGLSMKTSRNALFVDLTDSIVEKMAVMTRTAIETEENGGPKMVFWYFPIIPHMKRWFVNKKESELLRRHKDKHKKDARMIRRHTDATQWQNIDSQNPKFAIGPRNIRIAMSTDGMNPFMNCRTHS
jgi:hypothetical protein